MGGHFVISLDFELIWGMLDQPNLEKYKENIIGGRKAIRLILDLFQQYEIHATWAVVGIMAFDNKKEMEAYLPKIRPEYKNSLCSGYSYLNNVGKNENEDPLSYGKSLILKIKETPNQEIGTHTFSHYYCNEEGADISSFREDLRAAVRVMKEKYDIDLHSIVFPRNQVKAEFLHIVKEQGLRCYRSNPKIYTTSTNKIVIFICRILRLIDTYLPICGENCCLEKIDEWESILGTCASRFFRPYNEHFKILEPLKIVRIKKQMRYAAKHGTTFHLWWHPHNFGKNTEQMLKQLEDILIYYEQMNKKYGIKSVNMNELCKEYL